VLRRKWFLITSGSLKDVCIYTRHVNQFALFAYLQASSGLSNEFCLPVSASCSVGYCLQRLKDRFSRSRKLLLGRFRPKMKELVEVLFVLMASASTGCFVLSAFFVRSVQSWRMNKRETFRIHGADWFHSCDFNSFRWMNQVRFSRIWRKHRIEFTHVLWGLWFL
jgi:hypothetical protein